MITTDERIESLRRESLAAADYRQVDVCERALAGDEDAREECDRVISGRAAQLDPDDRLVVTMGHGVLSLVDPEGGRWWPSDDTTNKSELWAAYHSGRGHWHD